MASQSSKEDCNGSTAQSRFIHTRLKPHFGNGRSKNLVGAIVPSHDPMLTRPNDLGTQQLRLSLMLQIVLQILIEELEVSLPAVHPNDATVREKNRKR